jgi:hypothetical protein
MKRIIVLGVQLWNALQCSTAFVAKSLLQPRTIKLPMTSQDELADPHPQDIRSFLTQRSIQSFMYLLASTRDLHTVQWLDNFTKPVIINNYWEESDGIANPGVGDAFREGDKR